MTKSKPRWLSSSLIRHMDFNGISPTSSTAPQFSSISIDGLPTKSGVLCFSHQQRLTDPIKSFTLAPLKLVQTNHSSSVRLVIRWPSPRVTSRVRMIGTCHALTCHLLESKIFSNINSGCIISKSFREIMRPLIQARNSRFTVLTYGSDGAFHGIPYIYIYIYDREIFRYYFVAPCNIENI